MSFQGAGKQPVHHQEDLHRRETIKALDQSHSNTKTMKNLHEL